MLLENAAKCTMQGLAPPPNWRICTGYFCLLAPIHRAYPALETPKKAARPHPRVRPALFQHFARLALRSRSLLAKTHTVAVGIAQFGADLLTIRRKNACQQKKRVKAVKYSCLQHKNK